MPLWRADRRHRVTHLSCKKVSALMSRHHALNDLIYRVLSRANNIQAVREPTGLSRSDGKRPCGISLIQWQSGRPLTWDVTVANTMADAYTLYIVSAALTPACRVVQMAASRKVDKYSRHLQPSPSVTFVPSVFETLGPVKQFRSYFAVATGPANN